MRDPWMATPRSTDGIDSSGSSTLRSGRVAPAAWLRARPSRTLRAQRTRSAAAPRAEACAGVSRWTPRARAISSGGDPRLGARRRDARGPLMAFEQRDFAPRYPRWGALGRDAHEPRSLRAWKLKCLRDPRSKRALNAMRRHETLSIVRQLDHVLDRAIGTHLGDQHQRLKSPSAAEIDRDRVGSKASRVPGATRVGVRNSASIEWVCVCRHGRGSEFLTARGKAQRAGILALPDGRWRRWFGLGLIRTTRDLQRLTGLRRNLRSRARLLGGRSRGRACDERER